MSGLYCLACNEVFKSADGRCPRCGILPLHSIDGSLDTLVVPDGGEVTPSDVALDEILLDGQTIDIYECQNMLGRGGMGVVYLARNMQLHRQCALKILSPRQVSRSVDYVRRFENEGRAAAALVHPNVVTTHAIGNTGRHYFLEMEFVPGQSLQREIDSRGALGPLRATMLAVGIAEGLSVAHRFGIVHRDLKPDNVLVTPASVPKIVDFGLAKQIQSKEPSEAKLCGTPHFMAPELLQGGEATPASDVFALGVCYYVMLTGRYPFEGDSINSLMAAILTGEYQGIRRHNAEIPMDVAEAASLMLSRDPEHRPRDGAAAAQLLQAVLGAARDLDTLVYEAFHGRPGISYESDGHLAKVGLSLPGGRTQTVYLENSDHRAGDRLLNIFSVCCKATPDFYEDALRLNAIVLHGGLSIKDIDGVPCFVMVDTYPRGTVSAEEIRRSVIEVGSRADHIEHLLTGVDHN
ncbi:MAG: serine/threonine-protein kinase [Planctomycetaceae bacterium]